MVFYPVSLCHLSSFPLRSQTLLPLCCFHPLHRQQRKRKEKRFKNTFLSPENTAYILGYFFTCIFLLFGQDFGTLLFQSKEAGLYIRWLSFICPALYLSTTFTSIINGLGSTQITFFYYDHQPGNQYCKSCLFRTGLWHESLSCRINIK